jgi:phospholipase A1
LAASAALASGVAVAQEDEGAYERCLLEQLEAAPGETTVEELRRLCGALTGGETGAASGDGSESAVERRIDAERRTIGLEFVITPHHPNYVLLYSHNFEGNDLSVPVDEAEDQAIRDDELKFQLSLKMPLWRGLFSENNDLLFGFTLAAWWQAYAGDLSAPFRDINYQPELFLRHYGGPELFGVPIAGWDVGYVHQSNGRGGDLSRTWDRIVGRLGFDLSEELALGVEAWYRIPESGDRDDNPGIERWLGYGQARLVWAPGRHTVTAMVRPASVATTFELSWSFHLRNGVRLYSQYFDGYGESLLDYDKPSRRLGLGLAVSDFL